MAGPRSESTVVRGWRAEFRLWWAMAKHVDVAFDKARPPNPNIPNAGPGSISMCRACCQILSTRTCSGATIETAEGCDFHRRRPEVPIAVRSTITSVRLREMWKPNMVVESYYLKVETSEPHTSPLVIQTSLMDVDWVRRIRGCNKETKRSKKVYVHCQQGCVHSKAPESIVQGLGPQYIYFKRCDGSYFNAFGDQLEIPDPKIEVGGSSVCLNTAQGEKTLSTSVEHEELSIQPDQRRLNAISDDPETVSFNQTDLPVSFNEMSEPWAAISSVQESSNVTVAEAALVDSIKVLRRLYEQENQHSTPAQLEEGWKTHWTGCCAQLDAKKNAVNEEATESLTHSTTPDNPISATATVTASKSTQSEPSARFLMPYEYAAAKQIKVESIAATPLPVEMDFDPTKLAELAWRRLNTRKVVQEEQEAANDINARKRRRWWLKLRR